MNDQSTVCGTASTISTKCTNDQQWEKYHNNSGHGFAAEDANALYDRMHGRSVEKVGLDNTPNGADRIVDGVQIQSKYCVNAAKTVNSAFNNGKYRYAGMKLEVPSDQYEEAVRIMRGRIASGEVPGVTDPNQARNIVIKGHYTYNEAVRIAKAGNIDSIKFDVQTQSVACAYSFGLSFVITYYKAKSDGATNEEAFKRATQQAAKSGVTTMITGVAAQQLLRTEVGRNLAAAATKSLKPLVHAGMKMELGKQAITKTATALAGKPVVGMAAANTVTKALRTNAVISGVVFVGTTIPDIAKLAQGKISGSEFAERAATNAAGVGGGWAGASAGAAIGSMICPGVGTIIGSVVGGIGGGFSASIGIQKVIGLFK